MKNSVKILLQVLLWGILLIVPLYIMITDTNLDSKAYIGYLVRTGVLAVLFYLNYLWLIDKLLFNRRFAIYIVVNIVAVVALVSVQNLVLDSCFSPPHGRMRHKPEMMASDPQKQYELNNEDRIAKGRFSDMYRKGEPRQMGPRPDGFLAMRAFTDYLLIILVIGMSVALKATYRWYQDSMKLQETRSVQLEADLRNLRSQLNPHFLFNTLNNIYSLIAIDAQKAQDSVHRLSGLLRYVLYDNDQKFVPIQQELDFTQNYIDLMRLRVSSNVKVNVYIDGKDSLDQIASLMFMTLIENAFKHGLNHTDDCFIDIKIIVEQGRGVLCTVENSLAKDETNIENHNSGIGLANLSKRLELLYPNKHEFVAEKRDDTFFVLLRIDLNNTTVV